nr:phage minor head protein [Campylobacter blaseri]
MYVGSRRLKTIYNTNMRTIYAKSRYTGQMLSSATHFRYTAVMDNLTRAKHRGMHNLVLPKTDPFWDTNYPPNGWNCRCQVEAITLSEAKRRGLKVREDSNGINGIADIDFAYNPGKTDKLDEILAKKKDRFKLNTKLTSKEVNAILKDLGNFTKQKDLYVWKKGLNDMVDEVIVKNNQKTPLNVVQVGLLSKFISETASKLLNKEVKSGGMILTKKELSHARPQRKEAYNHAFRVEEMKEIVDVLNDENRAYVDLRDKHKNIVFIFEDKKDKTKLNLIPIEISKFHKKFKMKNYVITLDKADKEDIFGFIKGKKIQKIKQ